MIKFNQSDTNVIMLKGALVPSTFVGIALVIVMTLFKGSAGMYGALIGQIVVIIFFLISLAIAFFSKNAQPVITMALAMFSYFAKVLLLGALIFGINKSTSDTQVNRFAFGVTAITLTFTWLIGEVRAFFRLKLHLPLPDK